MNKDEKDLREGILALLSDPKLVRIAPARRAALTVEAVWQWLSKQHADEENRGKPSTDDALRVVLQMAPTHENIVRLALAFGRGVGAIEQIYRWAATPDKVVKKKRPDDAFIGQIKRIAKEVGWEAF
jgi:hypothetical protein